MKVSKSNLKSGSVIKINDNEKLIYYPPPRNVNIMQIDYILLVMDIENWFKGQDSVFSSC